MEKVAGIKKTVLITDYIACPRCRKTLFEEKGKDQEKVCPKCNVIVTKPGVTIREELPVEEKSPATVPSTDVKELELQFKEGFEEPILIDQPRVVGASDVLVKSFNKLEEVSQNITIGKIKQILVTKYLCCPRCGKNLVELKDTEVVTICPTCQLAVKRPSS